jgi:hypothetical protein
MSQQAFWARAESTLGPPCVNETATANNNIFLKPITGLTSMNLNQRVISDGLATNKASIRISHMLFRIGVSFAIR